jgi:hypothetical protein
MRNIIRGTFLILIVIAFGTCAFAQSKTPSLADAARANRKQKVPSERIVWTNENISNVSAKEPEPEAKPAPATDAAKATEAAAPEAEAKKECDKTKDAECEKSEAKEKADDSAKKSDDYKKKLKDMQDTLADLQKEASLNEREWKLAQAAYYGDAGTQLRNQKKFADDQSGHQNDMQRLQKEIDGASKKIEELKEQARKEGVNL